MSVENLFDKIDPNTWINVLDSYQKDPILEMGLTQANAEVVAQSWLGATTSFTAGFGASQGAKPFLQNIKNELLKFICDDNAYLEYKTKLRENPVISQAAIVAILSTAIASAIGVSAIYLTPVIVILLFSFGKITKNAFCKTYYTL